MLRSKFSVCRQCFINLFSNIMNILKNFVRVHRLLSSFLIFLFLIYCFFISVCLEQIKDFNILARSYHLVLISFSKSYENSSWSRSNLLEVLPNTLIRLLFLRMRSRDCISFINLFESLIIVTAEIFKLPPQTCCSNHALLLLPSWAHPAW